MRSSMLALLIVSQVFVSTASGQEQKPLEISSDSKGTTGTQSKVNITRSPVKTQTGPAYQRMSVSQRLIQQRAFLQAKQRLNRINARKAMGINPGRPTIDFNPSPIPTFAQIMMESNYLYFNPYQAPPAYWYGYEPVYAPAP